MGDERMMKTLRSSKGSAVILAITAISVSALVVGLATLGALSQSRKTVLRNFFKDQPLAVVEAIRSRAIRDLSDRMRNPSDGSSSDGTLNYILNPQTGKSLPAFNIGNPNIYGKGEFQIVVPNPGIPVLDTPRSNSGSTDKSGSTPASASTSPTPSTTSTSQQSLFTAPENNPNVWIESSGSFCKVILHIKVKLCTAIMSQRIPFANSDTGIDTEWNPACPTDRIEEVDYKSFLNIGSSLFAGQQTNQCATADSNSISDEGTTNVDYWRPFVVHSQQSIIPKCPAGMSQMWTGYSYLGSTLYGDNGTGAGGYNSPQDLSKPGSCLENFNGPATGGDNSPMRVMECTRDYCNYQSPGDYSTWLVTQVAAGNNWIMDFNKSDKAALAPTLISRCVVCEATRPVIVKHSYTGTAPSCPEGWLSQWTGFSFGTSGIAAGAEDSQSLSDTGSCLKIFVPHAITRGKQDACDRGVGFSSGLNMWLLNTETQSDTSYKDNTDHWMDNARRVSRCNVCVKK